MLPDLFASSTLDTLSSVVGFTQARHGVLAGNIANVNTPDYRQRDLSTEEFEASLREAIEAANGVQSPGNGLVLGPLALDAADPTAASRPFEAAEVNDPEQHLIFHDGRDVSLEEQVTEISKNQAKHNLAIALMSSQLRMLRAAISETVT